jgi:hypothetical protein
MHRCTGGRQLYPHRLGETFIQIEAQPVVDKAGQHEKKFIFENSN